MNIEFLYYFQALAQTQHYSHAAELLSITQPGLTYAMNELEKELGFELFIRKGRNIELTESGRIYYNRLTSILEQLDQAKLEASKASMKERDSCIIGAVAISAVTLLTQAFSNTISLDESKKVKIERVSASSVKQILALNKIDIALCNNPMQNSEYECIRIKGPRIIAIVPLDHPLASEKSICLKEAVSKYPFIWNSNKTSKAVKTIEQRFIDANIHPNIIASVENFLNAAMFVSNKMGIACVMDLPALPMYPVIRLPIEDFDCQIYYYVWRLKNSKISPIAEALWEFCKTQT